MNGGGCEGGNDGGVRTVSGNEPGKKKREKEALWAMVAV